MIVSNRIIASSDEEMESYLDIINTMAMGQMMNLVRDIFVFARHLNKKVS